MLSSLGVGLELEDFNNSSGVKIRDGMCGLVSTDEKSLAGENWGILDTVLPEVLLVACIILVPVGHLRQPIYMELVSKMEAVPCWECPFVQLNSDYMMEAILSQVCCVGCILMLSGSFASVTAASHWKEH